ncbi:MAG TPA: DUF1254 domain-containing protein [Mucilaginibacter sp.]|jgi:hypothetical protein
MKLQKQRTLNISQKLLILGILTFALFSCKQNNPAQTSNEKASPAGLDSVINYELGVPTEATAKKMFDELDYQRAVQVYLWGLSAVGMQQYRVANAQAMGGGSDDYKFGYLGELLKSDIEHLTGNPSSMYIDYFFDTRNGPIIAELPPTLPGFIDDMWEFPVIDIIPKVSPTGKYLIVPPRWTGTAPKDYTVVRPNTYVSWMLLRGNIQQTANGPDTKSAVEDMKTKIKIYPFSKNGQSQSHPQLQYFDMSNKKIDRVPPEGLDYFKRLAEVVNSEDLYQTDAFAMGLMKAIGMEPGKPFQPDERMTKILERAANTGQAMARTISFFGNDEGRYHWPDRKYSEAFMGGSPSFVKDGHTNHNARTYFFYLACGTSNLMASTTPGVGQAYPWASRDKDGNIFDGGKYYKMHLPKRIPAKLYWSVTCYDNKTRSQLHNGQPFSAISTFDKPTFNDDGSLDLYFGPKVPAGKQANWVKTVPGLGWFFLFRLYGPEKEYFEKSWKPDDLIEIKEP